MNLNKILFSIIFVVVILSFSITNAGVLDGARELNGHYYKIFDIFEKRMTWEDAKYYCISMGGHLATAENIEEISLMHEMEKNINYKYVWLGGYCDKNGFWRWITNNKIIIYDNWEKAGYPHSDSYSLDTYRLLLVHKYSGNAAIENGKWNDDYAHYKYGFMCEWESASDAHDSIM